MSQPPLEPQTFADRAKRAITVTEVESAAGKIIRVNGPAIPDMPAKVRRARRLQIITSAEEPCPEWVMELKDLVELQVTYEGYKELSAVSLYAPPQLRSLIVRGAGIRGISLNLLALWNLRILDIGRTMVSTLPADLTHATELRELVIDYPIADLPDWIGELTSLRRLVLAGTLITDLPEAIGMLTSLEELDVSRTKVAKLSSVIGSLRALRRLLANDAPIVSLAPEIGKLNSLQYINLEGCPLRRLPPEMGDLSDSIELRLRGTQLNEPFPALIQRGTSALFAYLSSLKDNSIAQYEAKVLLLGEGNVGKTSLVAALRGEPFQTNRPTTHGIELRALELPHPHLPERLRLTTWDFGGQELYRITHQFFYSPRSLYILVWRPREGQEENDVEGWIRRVKLRIGDTGKIILVATYGTEGRSPEIDFPYLKHKFGDTLLDSLTVDNETGEGIAQLRQVIAENAATLPQMGELFNNAWISSRDEILARRADRPYVGWHELTETCYRHGLNSVETTTLATLLHDLGHIIHFDEHEGLGQLVVLRPEWLTKAISYVLEDKVTRVAGGVLSYDRLADVWRRGATIGDSARTSTTDEQTYDPSEHPYFLRLMEKFDVSYRLPEQPACLVGQLVPYERPDLPWQADALPPQGTRRLLLICRMSETPPGLIAWLTVRNHRFWTGKHWRRGVFLEHTDHAAQALLELLSDGMLRLEVRAPSPDLFFSLMCDSIEYLIKNRWSGLRYEMLIPCPQRILGNPCSGLFNHSSVRRFRELQKPHIDCHVCAQPQEVARLLTGFELVISTHDAHLERIVRHLEVASADRKRVAEITAQTASHVRTAIKMLSTEIDDCPRLFIVEQVVTRKRMPWNDRFRLVLCCEHQGHEHPWQPATYNFKRPKNWYREVRPYAIFASRILKIAMPVAGSLVHVTNPGQTAQWLERQFKVVRSVAEQVSDKVPEQSPVESPSNRLDPAQGAGLRAYRLLLFTLDPGRDFGGLQQVWTTAGDVLWVCPDHYREHEPGLPHVP